MEPEKHPPTVPSGTPRSALRGTLVLAAVAAALGGAVWTYPSWRAVGSSAADSSEEKPFMPRINKSDEEWRRSSPTSNTK